VTEHQAVPDVVRGAAGAAHDVAERLGVAEGVQVGAADPAGQRAHQQLPGLWHRIGDFSDDERPRSGDGGTHGPLSSAVSRGQAASAVFSISRATSESMVG
jgi:hypothetical protein